MTAIAAPSTHAQLQGDLGFAYTFAQQELLIELMERFSVLPFVPLVGDAAGTGSNVLRITNAGGFGWAEAMVAAASETEAITPTGFTTGFDTVTVARYVLGKSASYQSEILGREALVMLDALKARIPGSLEKTIRQLVMQSGATITDAIGAAASVWDYDDELALRTHFNETEGYNGEQVHNFRHPEQMTQLLDAIRNEPGLQDPTVHENLQGVKGEGFQFTHLQMDNYRSFDVTQSGGGHQGFGFITGVFGWARASTQRVQVENPDRALFVPEFGLVIEEKTDGGTQATRQWNANAWFGVGKVAATVAPQVRIVSQDT